MSGSLDGGGSVIFQVSGTVGSSGVGPKLSSKNAPRVFHKLSEQKSVSQSCRANKFCAAETDFKQGKDARKAKATVLFILLVPAVGNRRDAVKEKVNWKVCRAAEPKTCSIDPDITMFHICVQSP